jgi:hypothetical protein
LASGGITSETAEHFGVGFFSGKGSMSGRVVIPIHNERGDLVAYAGRAIDGAEPRYKLPAGFHKSLELYNLHRAITTGQRGVILVEGFFDAMKLHQARFPVRGGADGLLDVRGAGGACWWLTVCIPDGKQPDQLSIEELKKLLGK